MWKLLDAQEYGHLRLHMVEQSGGDDVAERASTGFDFGMPSGGAEAFATSRRYAGVPVLESSVECLNSLDGFARGGDSQDHPTAMCLVARF